MAEVETKKLNVYEGLFLLDAGQTPEAALEPIKAVLDRSGAEILVAKPWDERRLAYEIKGRKRGLYLLVYFQVDPLKIADIEGDVKLNDQILRAMLLRKDDISEEEMNAETPATSGESGPHESAGREDEDNQASKRKRVDDSDDEDEDDDDSDEDEDDDNSDDEDKDEDD